MSFEEILELEKIRERQKMKDISFKNKFLELGIIEKIGKTSGTKFILSHRYYSYQERPGIYTRIKGISREAKKELILSHIKREGKGIKKDFIEAFPELKVSDISNLLQELKTEGKIKRKGSEKFGYWEILADSN